MKSKIGKLCRVFLFLGPLALVCYGPAVSHAEINREALREAVRLQRLSQNVWEALMEEHRFGNPVDSRTRLDVFNFLNGVEVLQSDLNRGQLSSADIDQRLELLKLQAKAVNLSLRNARAGSVLFREWENAQASLNTLARLVNLEGSPSTNLPKAPGALQNTNDVEIKITDLKHTGNFLKKEYRVRGTISGRNLVSAGVYIQGRLLQPITVPIQDRHFNESSFSFRMGAQDGVTIRVIDNQGVLVEKPVEFPAGGLFRGLR